MSLLNPSRDGGSTSPDRRDGASEKPPLRQQHSQAHGWISIRRDFSTQLGNATANPTPRWRAWLEQVGPQTYRGPHLKGLLPELTLPRALRVTQYRELN